ncbi:MAG TPA: DUF2336 domain-containing protein [Xanthobacteraceae bacterium]|nr:DUF2336 domain-containing protein [Xanthobacteraceae bacterium]
MIVRQFLQWVRIAPPSDRADATSALARAYLYSDLSPDDRAAAEGAMIMLLDDVSPLVRCALAEALAGSDKAPPAVIHSLAWDQPEVAAIVLARSPLLLDADLVELTARGVPALQVAIARRPHVPCSVSAAIAEVGCAESCLALAKNHAAEMVQFSMDRIAARFGHLAAVRNAMLDRPDLPLPTRQALVAKLSLTLAEFVATKVWLPEERARSIAKEACEMATVTIAATSSQNELRELVRHLRNSGQLTAGLLLRALLCGNIALFEEALVELSELSPARVAAILHDRYGNGFRALYDRAGLPAAAYPAFREAVQAMHEDGFVTEEKHATRLKRRIVERVLTRCESGVLGEIEPLLTLLRRFAAEAAREEARSFCQALLAECGRPATNAPLAAERFAA